VVTDHGWLLLPGGCRKLSCHRTWWQPSGRAARP
jgi:hypothetical protein